MQVTLLPAPDASIADLIAASRGGPRSEGIHVSHVIAALDKLQHPGQADIETAGWEWAATLGFLWEDVWEECWSRMAQLAGLHGPQVIRPGELEAGGMYLSPDGLCMEPELPLFPRPRLTEDKFSWRSVGSSPPESRWSWRMQVMAYLHVLHLTDCELVALYPMGNYRPPKPVLRRELWVFEQAELDACWEMLVGGAEWLRKQQSVGVG